MYTSRTHSQLAQAMDELKMTEYVHLHAVSVGSRSHLCINDDVLKYKLSSSAKVQLCRAKVKTKNCRYYSNVDQALKTPEVLNEPVLDIENLVRVGKSCTACPYYMSKQLSGAADIVFLPYNYVINPKLLKSFKLDMTNAIVIFDEAHNIEQVCQDAASTSLASSEIKACIEDIDFVIQYLYDSDDNHGPFGITDCKKIKDMVLSLATEVENIHVTSEGLTCPSEKVFELLSAANIVPQTAPHVIELVGAVLEFLEEISDLRAERKGDGLVKFGEFLSTIFGNDTSNWQHIMVTGYRLHIEIEKQWKGGVRNTFVDAKSKVLHFWCFNPSVGMSKLTGMNVHSIILTSGTLVPLNPLVSELGLPVEHRLENPHVIRPLQVLAKIIPQGPDGTPLNCNYQNRDNPKYLHSLALTIKTMASVTPNGMLVFFPSYVLMEKAQQTWGISGMWKAINAVKPIFTEPRDEEKFDECMSNYNAAAAVGAGAVLMAVLRGKVSEGLDFKDHNGRAVLVVGIPFPPFVDPRVVLKKQYLDTSRTKENELVTGQEWYNIEAIRAVNQAIGRVIRHKNDYGAIFLCDQRFVNYKHGLSAWIKQVLPDSKEKFLFGPVIKELGCFFETAAIELPQPIVVRKCVATSSTDTTKPPKGVQVKKNKLKKNVSIFERASANKKPKIE